LATEESKELAKKAGVKGDPQQAKECLSCHVTGYAAAADLKEASLTIEEGVSCEACHGPGSEYKSLKVMKDITAGKAKGADFGLVAPDKELCVKCHNTKSPTYKEFKFEEAAKKIAHPLPAKTD
jgi:nitrate/TMAO reductase-like tetraheme cytochrome c subunit